MTMNKLAALVLGTLAVAIILPGVRSIHSSREIVLSGTSMLIIHGGQQSPNRKCKSYKADCNIAIVNCEDLDFSKCELASGTYSGAV